jgi:hypothetical protein
MMRIRIHALVLTALLAIVAFGLSACGNCQAVGSNAGGAGRCGLTAGF